MSNDFFNNHPMLGSVFDFDHDGSMSFGEAMTMGGILGAFADEMTRDSERAERVSSDSIWDDDDDDEYFSDSKKHKRRKSYDDYDSDDDYGTDFEDLNGVSEVDASDSFEVMEAVRDPLYDWDDIEWLAEKALDLGTKFDEDEVEEICDRIYDHDLKTRLRCNV